MTAKTAFTPEEWQSLVQAPLVAGVYISMASPSITDSFKESMAVAKKLADSAQGATGGELLSAVLADFKDKAAAQAAKPKFEARDLAQAKAEAVEKLRQAVATLDAKATPTESSEFKQWLYSAATVVAEAAKEGDFMGIGGVRVSEEEKAALVELADLLGVQG